ncbi:hypothetical protein Taro_025890 [Colocasia esculenta]|uniref:Transposase-associated domain-containing protein n=1 Tax=Colocasia esculenta TaxID=4460 RepID=A0A843VPM7_COLES|nr:hypothetical protein [Colocasia esculenta]
MGLFKLVVQMNFKLRLDSDLYVFPMLGCRQVPIGLSTVHRRATPHRRWSPPSCPIFERPLARRRCPIVERPVSSSSPRCPVAERPIVVAERPVVVFSYHHRLLIECLIVVAPLTEEILNTIVKRAGRSAQYMCPFIEENIISDISPLSVPFTRSDSSRSPTAVAKVLSSFWIVGNELSSEFLEGVDGFIDFEVSNVNTVDPEGRIRCPCAVCKNNRFLQPFDVAQHLYKKGFVYGYVNWTAHGEQFWGHTEESYEQQLIERHGDDSSQHPQFDASAWLVAVGEPKKGRVFGFGTGMDVGGVINSTSESGCSATSYIYTQSPPPPQQPTELPDHYCSALIRQLDSWFGRTVVPALHAMGVSFPHPPPPPSTTGFGQIVGEQASSDADGDGLETYLADD